MCLLQVYSSATLLGQSPVALGFMHSFQPQISSSYPYSTPLGPLSPYGPSVPGSLPVQTCTYTHMHTHTHTHTLRPRELTGTSVYIHTHAHAHAHAHTHTHTHQPYVDSLHVSVEFLRGGAPTPRASCRSWCWVHSDLPPPLVLPLPLPPPLLLPEVHHGTDGHSDHPTPAAGEGTGLPQQTLTNGEADYMRTCVLL